MYTPQTILRGVRRSTCRQELPWPGVVAMSGSRSGDFGSKEPENYFFRPDLFPN